MSFASPAGKIPKLKLTGPLLGKGKAGSTTGGLGSTGVAGGSTGYGSSTPGTTGSTASQASPTSFTSLRSKPACLLAAYLVWQALIIGTGLTLWRWRAMGGVT